MHILKHKNTIGIWSYDQRRKDIMKFDAVYYEKDSLSYTLGKQLQEQFADLPWIPVESHNSIKEMQEKKMPNSAK